MLDKTTRTNVGFPYNLSVWSVSPRRRQDSSSRDLFAGDLSVSLEQ